MDSRAGLWSCVSSQQGNYAPVCTLNFLSLQRLIYNSDIKPDNILLDAKGHAALTDLNIAMHYSQHRLHTSVAGSMAYMAPEVVDPQRSGYSWQVDWWSLGVCAFELLWHRRPFDGNSAERMRDSILTHPIRKPSQRHGPVSGECTSAVFGVSPVEIVSSGDLTDR